VIQQKTYLYEALFRFDEKGYLASHQIHTRKVWDDETGEVITEQQLPAAPLEDEDIAAIVGDAMQSANSIDALRKDFANLQADKRGVIEEYEGRLSEQDAAFKAGIAEMQAAHAAQLAEHVEEIKATQRQVDAAKEAEASAAALVDRVAALVAKQA
jgi:hypothetical protein